MTSQQVPREEYTGVLGAHLSSGAAPNVSGSANTRGKNRITEGQLEAIAMRLREELATSLRRAGTAATATLHENVLSVCIEHSLAAAEHHLMRRAAGRQFFQHYIEELVEQMYPTFTRHVEHILPCSVSYTGVKVDCDNDCIIFTFGLRHHPDWR